MSATTETRSETTFFPSRQRMERLEGKSVVVLDVDEATGRPRLVAVVPVAPEMRNGLFVANNPINAVDPLGLWTFGFGGQGSVNLVGSISVSIGIFVGRDPSTGKWSFGVLGTLAPGIGGPGDIGGGGFFEVTDAPCVNSLKGPGIDLGIGGGEVAVGGVSYVAGIDSKTLDRTYNGVNVDFGLGGGMPVSAHVRGSGTAGWDTGGGWR